VTLKTGERRADVRHVPRRSLTVPPARTGSRLRRTGLRLSAAALAALSLAAVTAPATSTTASAATAGGHPAFRTPARADNPLAGTWGVYKGPAEQAWAPYASSTGEERTLLGKIALRPKAKWFGAWIPNQDIAGKVSAYIANASGGDPDVLVQMTVFNLKPWEHNACTSLPTADQQAGYKQWIDNFAGAIGAQHTAVILQPDGPFALCAPGGSKLPSHLIGYAARELSALPNTSVYIDAGASDWPSNDPEKAAQILLPAGIQYARGFALNSTHYSRTVDNIDFGTRLVEILASHGVPGKHFVINTSSNGHGFTFNKARGGNRDNAKVCQTMTERVCVTLGPPPTTNVASSRWRQSALHRQRAAAHVDAYMWFGRPWLYMQADPFVKSRALAIARTTPW
jgi:endoglucanase